ncbi:extracellular elastinolytic metalloproteinase [Ulvibacter sp. MAR_2010_11]|uniref:M36 family metallopeptidase n=1 Tax=Ulvibacter sp. MAR_2010_11 TaxID=1250229 RepID=UPI000C2C837F|nr:M36 family metallopeptidase [Ulvibacter sp. MAR_2010_11]PKA83874.1 extracellular elastinolytic metalloproteinase [Ulvibacter sp. MAR_2010_11]
MKKITFRLFLGLVFVFAGQIMAQKTTQSIDDQLQQLRENSKITQEDVKWEITNETVSRVGNVSHIYYRQTLNGLQIYGTESGVHTLPNGKVISASNHFINNAVNRAVGSSTPALTAVQAVQSAASQLNYNITETLSVISKKKGVSQESLISDGGISLSPIPAKLMYQLNQNDELVLVWDISIQEKSQQDWWSMRVDAASGVIVDKVNWMLSCAFEHDHSDDAEVIDYNANLFDIPNYNELVANANSGCNECYEVFAMPIESPYYGSRTVETFASNAIASPFGWHDTNGAAGAEFTVTRGNNVNAYEDGNNPGYQPDGGASLYFVGYPFSQIYSGANQYEDAAITNLFYWNNIIHDLLYQYGFDEAGGNFQENNYGNGGLGSDSVNAEAQDGSGTCNANFGTPADGGNPTMQMYVCGDKDGDFDNLVIVHEYGHGISNRLTGGPGAAGCLGNQEQMGEGWSDFYGVLMSIESGDTGTDERGVGTYLFGQGPGGAGIRPYPYTTDMTVNPQTYDDIKTAAVPHGVGSVWATMMWEVTWALIDEYGFDTNFYNFTGDVSLDAGNIQAFALVTEAMKLQPCSPGFVDGRDAIFAADLAIYGGANECILWDAFAKRGLGVSADQGSSASRSDGTEAFDTPSGLATFTAPDDVCANSPVLTGLSGGSPLGGVYSGTGVTDDGNGSTYSFDPVAAGVGLHTITYDVPAGVCSIASSASDDIEVLAIPPGPVTVDAMDFCPGTPVTVSAVLSDPLNVIRWYDAPIDGTFLFEGEDYTFNPVTTTTVYAQETPPGPLSQLKISETRIDTPDTFELQNVGLAADYSGYTVAVSDDYSNINIVNSITKTLGAMAADSVVFWDDSSGSAQYWGNNLFWSSAGTGWIIVIDDTGNVVDSLFWNWSAAAISGLNVTINGFNVTGADLDWTGIGASFTSACPDSFRRHDDTDSATDWAVGCEAADFGVANSDINLGFDGCLGDRSPATATVDALAPVITCPADETVSVNPGDQYTLPDYTALTTATDNCTASPVITQDPVAGTMVGVGVTVVTMTATDDLGNASSCTFNVTVDEILGVSDSELGNHLILYPNPTQGQLTLINNTTTELLSAVIMDVNGRLIQTINLSNTGVSTEISVEALATGMYFVKINTATTSIVKRIVKH